MIYGHPLPLDIYVYGWCHCVPRFTAALSACRSRSSESEKRTGDSGSPASVTQCTVFSTLICICERGQHAGVVHMRVQAYDAAYWVSLGARHLDVSVFI